MRFRSKDEAAAEVEERAGVLRAARERQQRTADETGIWSFLGIDEPAFARHKCLRCGVPVIDKDVHLAWHERIGDPWP